MKTSVSMKFITLSKPIKLPYFSSGHLPSTCMKSFRPKLNCIEWLSTISEVIVNVVDISLPGVQLTKQYGYFELKQFKISDRKMLKSKLVWNSIKSVSSSGRAYITLDKIHNLCIRTPDISTCRIQRTKLIETKICMTKFQYYE